MKKLAILLSLVLLTLGSVSLYLSVWGRPAAPSSDPHSAFQEALYWYGRGKPQMARESLKKYCEAKPHDLDAKLLYARVCIDAGRTSEATAILDELARNGRTDVTISLLQAKIAKNSGQSEAAVSMIQAAIQYDPNSALVWRELGLLQVELGQPMQALSSIQRSLQIDPSQEDLSRLSAELSLQAATAQYPGKKGPDANSMVPSIPNPNDMMPKLPGGPASPNPRSRLPTPGQGSPFGSGRGVR